MSFKDILTDVSELTNELFGEYCALFLVDPYDANDDLLLPSISVIVDKGKPIKGDFNSVIGYKIAVKILKTDLDRPPRATALIETLDKHVYELGDVIEQSKTAHWFECLETSTRFPTDTQPIPDFNSLITGLDCEFTNLTPEESPVIKSTHWDFGDGQTSNELNPIITFSNTGYYDITLTVVSDTNYSNSITKGITIL